MTAKCILPHIPTIESSRLYSHLHHIQACKKFCFPQQILTRHFLCHMILFFLRGIRQDNHTPRVKRGIGHKRKMKVIISFSTAISCEMKKLCCYYFQRHTTVVEGNSTLQKTAVWPSLQAVHLEASCSVFCHRQNVITCKC